MIRFKILLGKSEEGKKHSLLKEWANKVDKDIEIHEDKNGILTYLIGDFISPFEASDYFEELQKMGLKPIEYFGLRDGCLKPYGWNQTLDIGVKKENISPKKA